MIYTFKSKATADVIMLGPNGDHVLEILGRSPSAKGIFEVADMPRLVAALEEAVKEEPARDDEADDAGRKAQAVALRARVWPLVEMMRRAHKAGDPIVWGV